MSFVRPTSHIPDVVNTSDEDRQFSDETTSEETQRSETEDSPPEDREDDLTDYDLSLSDEESTNDSNSEEDSPNPEWLDSLRELPEELSPLIGQRFPLVTLSSCTLASRELYKFFAGSLREEAKSILLKAVAFGDQKTINKISLSYPDFFADMNLMKQYGVTQLLRYISLGRDKEAEKMVIDNPKLLEMKGLIIDERTGAIFEGIYPLQYPIWALDRHMWERLAKHAPRECIELQLNQHFSETNPPAYVKRNGKHFSLDKLLIAYENFMIYYQGTRGLFGSRSSEAMYLVELMMCIGAEQKRLPDHFLQEIIRRDRSFEGEPDFNEIQLERNHDFYDSPDFRRLGIEILLQRGEAPHYWALNPGQGMASVIKSFAHKILADFEAIFRLKEVRLLDVEKFQNYAANSKTKRYG